MEDQYLMARVSGKAPDFTANAYEKGSFRKISLHEDYLSKGKWVVLFFYPLDFTFVCPTEIKEFSAKAPAFEAEGAAIIGVSVDSEYSHQAWCNGSLGDLNFPLVSDITKDISISYDVLHDDGIALRGTFIIDPEGTIHHATINNLPLGRSADETLRVLQAAKSGELCPAGWHKGQETLGKA
jgi:peroxiredoxin 2/4